MAKKKAFKATPAMNQLLVKAGSMNKTVALAAQAELAKALELPLREGIMYGNILSDIFETIPLTVSTTPEFPLDFLAPGTEKEFVAYTIPNHGYIPQKTVEGDYVMVPTYETGASIDMLLKYARDARWDVVGRAQNVLELEFVKKLNDDGFHTVLAAAADRNIAVLDADANPGQFTKRLVSLAKTVMRRNGGGNSSSINRGKLTDVYMSPEAVEDIRNWGIDQVDEFTRREIYTADDGNINRVFEVNLHAYDEFGEGQEYQLFCQNQLGVTLPSGRVEVLLGLDLSKNDSFVNPVRQDVQIFEDDNLHRQRRMGWYGWWEGGFAALDSRRNLLMLI